MCLDTTSRITICSIVSWGEGGQGGFFCQTTKKNSKWHLFYKWQLPFLFSKRAIYPIISPCMNAGIRMCIIRSDELQNLWTARTVIVNCWHVNPPDSCWLYSEAQAISECGNLKKTCWIRHWPHTHTQTSDTQEGSFCTLCIFLWM